MSSGFLSQLGDERVGDPLTDQRLEAGQFGALRLAAHRGTLPQLVRSARLAQESVKEFRLFQLHEMSRVRYDDTN